MEQKGFALVMLLITLVIFAVLAVGSYSFYMGKNSGIQPNYKNPVDSATEAKKALEKQQEDEFRSLTPTPTPIF